ncbi:MAG TPA: serine/threonine-protein kinase [Polyangiaceae bacterium]
MAIADLEPIAPLSRGSLFNGRYRVVRCIKYGGMGAVYEVIHVETRRRRALKVMLPGFTRDPELRARFRREATVAADVQSEHIIEIFDAGIDEQTSQPFLVMELLRGEDLGALLGRLGKLPASQVVSLLQQVGLLLDRTHAQGVVHRDLKPENLFLTGRDDGSLRVKVLDFGIAKVVAIGTNPHTTGNFGTPLYMSPEQMRGDGDIGPAADIWALGQLAYALLTGQPYWKAEATGGGLFAALQRLRAGLPESAVARAARRGVELPSEFDAWFGKVCAADAARRFETASETVEALASALGVHDSAPQLVFRALVPRDPDGDEAKTREPGKASRSSRLLMFALLLLLPLSLGAVALARYLHRAPAETAIGASASSEQPRAAQPAASGDIPTRAPGTSDEPTASSALPSSTPSTAVAGKAPRVADSAHPHSGPAGARLAGHQSISTAEPRYDPTDIR